MKYARIQLKCYGNMYINYCQNIWQNFYENFIIQLILTWWRSCNQKVIHMWQMIGPPISVDASLPLSYPVWVLSPALFCSVFLDLRSLFLYIEFICLVMKLFEIYFKLVLDLFMTVKDIQFTAQTMQLTLRWVKIVYCGIRNLSNKHRNTKYKKNWFYLLNYNIRRPTSRLMMAS